MIFFTLVKLPLGEVGLVWQLLSSSPRLVKVFFSVTRQSVQGLLQKSYPEITPGSHPLIDGICQQLKEYDQGQDIHFSVPDAGSPRGSEFYRRVWRETSRIPRGKVCTYGQIATKIDHPRAARAVGTALAANPFPLLIPCHRVIRSGGELGNYSAGGPAVKQHLLEREGVLFDHRSRVMDASLLC